MIAPIVEGKSEVGSVPELLRRIAGRKNVFDVLIGKPFRIPRGRIVKDGEIERAVKLIQNQRTNVETIIVLIDADDDVLEDLRPWLLERAQKVAKVPVTVILANH